MVRPLKRREKKKVAKMLWAMTGEGRDQRIHGDGQ